MAHLKLFVLGQPRLEREERPIELNLRKALALLVYLVVSGQPHSRDALATLLWPESDGREGRTRLRRTLHRLSQALGDNVLDAGPDTIRLHPAADVWLDSTAFRQHATAGLAAAAQDRFAPERLGHLSAAVELYWEDFLVGFTLPDSPTFDEWQFFQRESLRQLYGQVLEQLVQAYRSQQVWDQAIAYARRWLTLDGLHEPAHRMLMRLYAWAGQHAAALRQYHECTRVLNAELGIAPEEETTALYETIRTRQLVLPEAADHALRRASELSETELHQRSVPEQRLAEGRQDEVLRGRHQLTGQSVAINWLKSDLAERHPEPVTRFVRAARGELPADHLPPLPKAQAGTAPNPSAPMPEVRREHSRTPTNLPAPLTSFVGRGHELEGILALLERQRLVTLTGVGGVGKTRLATEVGIHIVRHGQPPIARDGVWIVELASLADPALVAQAIGSVFHLAEQGGRPMMELLQEHLAQQQLLLILDNCEHLIDVCAEIVEQLVLHCWQLRILATSREPLRVPGERTTPILPLTLPEPNDLQAAQILSTPAAQLFVARMDAAGSAHADATAPIDQIDSTDAVAIAQICRQLDGIPLALELAAPLSHNTPLSEIAAQLENQMEVLTNRYRTAVPRHQTMHSALVWSYRLLAPEEQRLLASVSVFAGGWTLEAAQAISVEGGTEPWLSALDQLVAKSVVLQEEHGRRRYRLLEPVRQFAQTQLVASGAEDAVRRRHAAYFLKLAEHMHHARDTSNEGEWLDRLEPERDNLRAVNSWAIEYGEAELVHRFNGWLFAFWIYRSSKAEARRWVDAALALTAPIPSTEALTAEELALNTAGYLACFQREYGYAQACFQRELEIYTQIGHQPGIATACRGLGFTAMHDGDLERAAALTARSLVISQSVQDQAGVAWSLFDLGYLALVRGDLCEARARLEQALPELLQQDIQFGAFRAMIALGHVMRALGEPGRAINAYTDALQIQQGMHYVEITADALEGLAGIAATRRNPARAAQLFGAAQAHRETHVTQRPRHLDGVYARDLALAQGQLTRTQWEAAWQRGYSMPLDQAAAYALPGHADAG
jgi:predicted ATPase/DNA-binding SARP family transcriptional activator